jgi:alcohol dehydrogenase
VDETGSGANRRSLVQTDADGADVAREWAQRVLDMRAARPRLLGTTAAGGTARDSPFRRGRRKTMMKAVVYQGPGKKALEERAIPKVQAPTDAIVRVIKTTICGTDLHILKGDVPTCSPGRILGHEGVGVVERTGPGVTTFHPGDSVLISCISACGKCEYCRRGMSSHCTTGGWILGNEIDGTQAEYVRIPHADTSLHLMPAGVDEQALVMLSDILPTGLECGVLNGKVQPGNSVAIVGAGPVGLAALLTAKFYSPAEIVVIDFDDHRLQVAERLGATVTINAADGDVPATLMKMTSGRGFDTAIEAVGVPATFATCEDIVAPGGTIANVGVHGVKVDLHLERLWSRNITITTRLVDTVTMPMLLKTVQSRKLDPKVLITHHFKLDCILDAYDTFTRAASTQALKVVINAN